MTLIDGLLYTVGGWSAISAAAVAVVAAVVTLGAELARRVAGPLAGTFAFVALLGSQPLLLDEVLAYAAAWAALWLLIAAFALRAVKPHYVVVGAALCMAALTRLESIVVVVGALVAIATWAWLRPRLEARRPGLLVIGPAPRGAGFVALGALAVPIMLIHDWVLIRNPMFWASVSAGYSTSDPTSVRSPAALLVAMTRHYAGMPLMVVLACVGAALLLRRRQVGIAMGLALVGPGIGVLLLVLAARGTYVSARYLYLMDLALVMAAAIGFAAVRSPAIAGVLRARARAGLLIVVAGTGLVAAAATVPFGPLDLPTRRIVLVERTVAVNLRTVEPILARLLLTNGGPKTGPVLVAPGLWTPRLIVDLRLPIPDVAAARLDATPDTYAAALHVGELVYHDRAGDPVDSLYAAMEVGGPVTMRGITLALQADDSKAGWWIYRVIARP